MKSEPVMEAIHRLLPQNPEHAFALLPRIPCDHQRQLLAGVIAQVWSRKDITTAWDTVASSCLSAAGKQMFLNALWS